MRGRIKGSLHPPHTGIIMVSSQDLVPGDFTQW